MTLRRWLLIALIGLFVAPLAAQVPEGWRVRIDRSTNAQDPDNTPNLMFMKMGPGFHVVSGPAGTFWHPSNNVSGNYTVKGTFTLLKLSPHRNYYGLIFGASALDGADQTYIYFLVAQDGSYIIRRRVGENVSDVKASTVHEAVRRPDSNGRSVNALELRVAGNTVSYVVNGTVVHTTPKSDVTAMTDGLAGIRINHLLEVQVDGFEVQKS